MKRHELVRVVASKLGNITDIDDLIAYTMKMVQREAEQWPTMLWFLLTEKASTVTRKAEPRIPVPVDFLREYEEGCLLIESGDSWKCLDKVDFEAVTGKTSQGTPCQYALTGDYFRLYPVPDGIYTLRMIYYAAEPELESDDSTNEWTKQAASWFTAETAARLALDLELAGKVEALSAEAQYHYQRLMTAHEARAHANMSYVMGGD